MLGWRTVPVGGDSTAKESGEEISHYYSWLSLWSIVRASSGLHCTAWYDSLVTGGYWNVVLCVKYIPNVENLIWKKNVKYHLNNFMLNKNGINSMDIYIWYTLLLNINTLNMYISIYVICNNIWHVIIFTCFLLLKHSY